MCARRDLQMMPRVVWLLQAFRCRLKIGETTVTGGSAAVRDLEARRACAAFLTIRILHCVHTFFEPRRLPGRIYGRATSLPGEPARFAAFLPASCEPTSTFS